MIAKNISDRVELNNGVLMPWIGLGVWAMDNGKEVVESVKYALNIGYRSIDTASLYANEKGVGIGLKESCIKREDLFITSKVWNSEQGYKSTLKAFDRSLKKINTDYLDLYLIHWPVEGKYKETWKALEKLYEEKLIRAIGVSNFMIDHLEDLFTTANVVPAVNQIEFHPYLTHKELVKYCEKHLIQVEAYSPIMQGKIGNVKEIVELGKKYNKSPAQIVLRWDMQNEIIAIPKSSNPIRIKENSEIFDFELTDSEMNLINSIDINSKFGDPENS